MSTRRERAERKHQIEALKVSACSYGVHAFVWAPQWESKVGVSGWGTHLHECTACGASCFADDDPCPCPRPETTS